MLNVTNVSKVFMSGDAQVTAVKDVSFQVSQGRLVAVVGRSGSGKSTLMGLLGALDKPTRGAIEVDGRDITTLKDRDQVTYRGSAIGFVFQGYNLIPNLSALENVILPMESGKLEKSERTKRAKSLLDQVGLAADKQRRKPGRLSGGEQQRVAIARALANKPKLILADEPTGNLDSHTSDMIVGLLRKLVVSERTTIIIVTHDDALAEQADIIFQMQDGALTEKHRRQS